MNKKAIVSKAMSSVGLPPVLTHLRSLYDDEITILAYHRILDIAGENDFPFDPELVSASPADFRWQMEYVRRHYTPISFRRLLDSLDGNDTLPPRPILITFDDGFDDNYRHAFPVLRSLDIPATIFISTGYIGQTRTFWFDWLYYLCNKSAVSSRAVRLGDKSFSLSRDPERRSGEISGLFGHAKTLPDEVLRESLSMLEKEHGTGYPENGFAASHPLNWDQVREMARHGIEFGSHTVTHPILANVSDAKLREELALSRSRIEQETGHPVAVICYPVGLEFAFNDKVIAMARATGYRLGVSYLPGVNSMKRMDRFRLKRLHVERYVDRDEFRAMLALPEIFV